MEGKVNLQFTADTLITQIELTRRHTSLLLYSRHKINTMKQYLSRKECKYNKH